MLRLRPYQEAAVAAVLAGKTRRPPLVLATSAPRCPMQPGCYNSARHRGHPPRRLRAWSGTSCAATR